MRFVVRRLPRLAFTRLAMTVGGSAVLLFVFRQPENHFVIARLRSSRSNLLVVV
ncbi:MAG: hypothetical protein IJR46_01205 [Neisseriaceae bacterium]|nr:hypothetical protein [Neisseriaceae bacterium]